MGQRKINFNWESDRVVPRALDFYKKINLNSESSVENEVDSRVPSSSTVYRYKGYTIYWEKNRTYLIHPNGDKFYNRRIVQFNIIKLYIDDPSSSQSQILWSKQHETSEEPTNLKGFKGSKFYEAGYFLYNSSPSLPHARTYYGIGKEKQND